MIVNEIKEVLLGKNKKEIIELLSHLSDVFESYNKNIQNFNQVVQLLVNMVVTSDDDEIISEMLDTICKAEIYQNISKIDFTPISNNINSVSEKFTDQYIEILGFTNDKKYIPIISQFRNHTDPYIAEAVEDALNELEYNS